MVLRDRLDLRCGQGKEEACREAKRDLVVAEVHLDFIFMGGGGERKGAEV